MKKFAVILISALLIMAMTFTTLVSAKSTLDENKATGSLTLTKYETDSEKTISVSDAEFTAYKIAEITSYGTFKAVDAYKNVSVTVGDSSDTKTYALNELMKQDDFSTDKTAGGFTFTSTRILEEMIPALQSVAQDETNPQAGIKSKEVRDAKNKGTGEYKFTDLPLGVYLVVETKAPQGYVVSSQSFLASVPEWDNEKNNWNYDVTASPKNATTSPDKKIVKNDATVKEDTVKDYNSMPVFIDLAKDTGTDVKWIYNTSIQYANNADPVGIKGIDAIHHCGFSNLKLYNYGRRNRIVAIDKYLSSMPNFSEILKKRPDIKEALKSPDGHIYSLPRIEEMGLKAYPNILYLNKAWVNELINNNDLPDGVNLTADQLVDGLDLTRNQFKAILQKFNVRHSNGVPLAFIANNWQGNISDLVSSFGLPENRDHKTIIYDEAEEKDKVTFTFTDEKWLAATQELSNWFSNKLFRTSVFTDSESDFLAKGQSGKYGAFYWWEKKTVVKNPDDYIIVKPLINDETGKRYVGVSNELEIEKGECVILDACKDKKGLLAYFDKFFEPKYSAQLNYGSISSGAFLPQTVNGKLIPNDDHGNQSADDFRMKNAPYGVVYLTEKVWEERVGTLPSTV